MEIAIDFRSGQPIYLQIVEQVRKQIMSGELVPGDQLPTVRQLAADLRVNFNTVARAYRLLDEAGLISTQLGRGTYVWEKPSQEAVEKLRSKTLHEQVMTFLDGLSRQGYSLQEIEAEFVRPLRNWKENGNERQS